MLHPRRIVPLILILALIVSLSGCIIIPRSKYYDLSADAVESVQFYDLRGEEPARGLDPEILNHPVCTLPEDKIPDFLRDFSQLEFTDTIIIVLAAVDPSFAYGEWIVRINFTGGEYTLYSCAGYGETYDSEGNVVSSTHFSCDLDELKALIGKYYDIP